MSGTVDHRFLLGISFVVQSEKKLCHSIINSIDKFLLVFKAKLEKMSDDDFKTYKDALSTLINKKDINLSESYRR